MERVLRQMFGSGLLGELGSQVILQTHLQQPSWGVYALHMREKKQKQKKNTTTHVTSNKMEAHWATQEMGFPFHEKYGLINKDSPSKSVLFKNTCQTSFYKKCWFRSAEAFYLDKAIFPLEQVVALPFMLHWFIV